MTISVHWQQDSTYPAATDRLLIAGAMFKGGAAAAREGCVRSADLEVTAAGGSMSLTIAAGQAVIDGYLLTNDDDVTLTPDVGGATDRTDLIIARVYDEESGDDDSEGTIEIVKGTSTTEPDLPDRSIKLAAVAVDASVSTLASGDLTDKRTFTTSAGGVLWLPGGLADDVPATFDDGEVIWDSSAGQLGVNDGGTWRKFVDLATLVGEARTDALTEKTDWSITDQYARKAFGWVFFQCGVTYSGSSFTTNSTGGLSDKQMVAFEAGWETAPATRNTQINAWGPSQEPWTVGISTAGVVSLMGGPANSQSIDSGDSFAVNGIYQLGTIP